MDETFRPTLLLSMPQLQDPNFTRTVVLLCDYTEEGAFGLVLNRPTEMPATTMVKLDPPIAGGNELPLSIGGPVEPERGWILTNVAPEDAEYREIQEGLYSVDVPVAAAPGAVDDSRAGAGAGAGGLRRMGPRTARRGACPVSLADGRRRARSRVRRSAGRDVGYGDPQTRGGSLDADDESGSALNGSWVHAVHGVHEVGFRVHGSVQGSALGALCGPVSFEGPTFRSGELCAAIRGAEPAEPERTVAPAP